LSVINPSQHTILLVDDDTHDSTLIQSYLESAGFEVSHLHGVADIWPHLQSTQPDLVVMLISVPEAPALDICRTIKESDTLSFLPLILVAPPDHPTDRLDGMRSGADEYLVQPVDEQTFLMKVRRLLSIKQRFDKLIHANRQLNFDLAERNAQLESALQTAHELDVVKTAIVRNVSHELRTPVLQVKSAIALLNEDTTEGDPNRSLLDMAIQAIGRLESTVASITQLAESQNLKLEPVALNESVDLAIRNLERSWKSQQDYQRIKKLYGKSLPLVYADKRGIAQVLYHLLDNALKFSPDGGPVEIFIEERGSSSIWLSVKDYGIGISEEELAHIFESFYQVDSSSTRQFSGVGVGLTIAQLMMKQMNSRIEVASSLGEGSTFSFTLPRIDLDEHAGLIP
jgi:two-component system sensor histidine kinase/response regulator